MVTLQNIPKGQNPTLDALREKLFGKNRTTTLSEITTKAQQSFSEKYGVGTFDLTGKVNTIPLTRPYDTRINIGTGSTGLTSQALNETLAKLSPQKALVPTQDVFSSTNNIFFTAPKDSKLIEGEIPLGDRNTLPSFTTTIQQYLPYIVLGGIALAGLTLLKR